MATHTTNEAAIPRRKRPILPHRLPRDSSRILHAWNNLDVALRATIDEPDETMTMEEFADIVRRLQEWRIEVRNWEMEVLLEEWRRGNTNIFVPTSLNRALEDLRRQNCDERTNQPNSFHIGRPAAGKILSTRIVVFLGTLIWLAPRSDLLSG
ncbi:hypothetical protein FQN50_004631 [Emmonsiellopsis sp. PD_5]|nr:hypothetical protein FQN50_004631 [Emmonsiellopsis sp. PD_5]